MDKQDRTDLINSCWIKMEQLHELNETATNDRDRKLYQALYEAFHALYMILTDDRLKEKKERLGLNG